MIHTVADFHTHILPGIDDGSADLQESLAMLREQAKQGISHVVATPHFYPRYDTPDAFLHRRKEAELRLRDAMAAQPGLPGLSVGAEVHYFPGISESDILPRLTIDEKACILIEMPLSPWTGSMYRELENIRIRQGLTPVIAHVDRYIRPFATHRIPEKLGDLPVIVQANASFFLDKATSRMALRMLQKDQIQLLGSDCHNLTDRAPNLGPAVERIGQRLGKEVFDRILMFQNEVLELEAVTL